MNQPATQDRVYPVGESDRFRALVEAVTDFAIYMLDPTGIVTSWNAGAQRFKGYSADEIIGQHFSRFYTQEDQAGNLPARALDIAAREGKFEAEGWRVRRDGTRFWAHVVIDPIRDPGGRLAGFAKITRDITERKQAQEALGRTREVLFQSQKMDAVGQMTGGVAHDFNNLLMAVLGSLELLRKRLPDDPRMLRLLDNAVMGAQRGATLTQRMLSFSRRQQMDVRPVNVQALVTNMTDLLQSTIGTAAEIQTDFPVLPCRVVADANQLELALLNLCVNARDAMKKGGRIAISLREEQLEENSDRRLAPGRYICLSVRDDGEGMSRETLARASEPFFTTKGVGKGTGLGLSMVHGMAEQVGGRLLLNSALGEGTTAEIWIPAYFGANDSSVAPSQADDAAASAPPLRVLAVDDDWLVLFNTTAMLEELGHSVTEASSGEEALELLGQQPFDLVISDQAMPRMTGVQLMAAIRERWPELPMILATGYAEIPGDVTIKPLILNKPFSENELARALTALAH